jgi:PAS domain S-box-containing protein
VKKNKEPSGKNRSASGERRKPPAGKTSRRPPAKTARPGGDTPKVESKIESERRRFFNVLETLPAYLILLAPNYTVPFENKFFRERFGESRGRRCHEYLFQRPEPCENCETYKVLKTNAPHHWEWTGPDNRIYDIHDFPFTDSDGSPLIMEMGVDITERKQAEAALTAANAALEGRIGRRTSELAESERRWATTLASIGDAVIATDCEGRITFMNPTAEALTRWNLKDAVGQPAGEVFHIVNEFTRLRLEDPVAKVLATGAVVGLANHTLLVRRDGTEIAVDDSGAPIIGADGESTGAVLVFRDITDRRAAEKKIQDMARFPEENPNPVLRVDRKGKVMYANPACRDIGLEPCIEPGLTIPPEWITLVDQAFAAKGQQAADIAVGDKVYLLTAAPIADEGYANLYTIDVTDRRRKETELARVNRTLKAISESNQAMMRSRNEQDFMEEVCRIVVGSCGHAMVWIGMAEEDEGRTVRPVAHSGFEEDYLETLRLSWADNEYGRGPTGTAIRTGKVSQCRNILTDPAFAPWRAEALKRGYASSIALPLLEEERAFGAVMIYSREPDPFSDEEVGLLEELAGDLSYGIQAIRTRAMRDNLLTQVEEQRRLAQQLADERGAVFASLSEAVLVYDADGRVRRVNAAAVKLLGFDPTQLTTGGMVSRLNTRSSDGLPLDPARSPTARALAGTSTSGERFLLTGAGGREMAILASAAPLVKDNLVSGAVTVMHDVTEEEKLLAEVQRRALELESLVRERTRELEEANSYNRSLIEATIDPMMTITPDGKIGDVNAATEKVTGFTRTGLIGTDFSDYFTDGEKARAGYRRVFDEGKVNDYELEIRRRDGLITPVLYNASVYTDETRKAKGVIAAARDITRRRQTEEKIRENTRRTETVAEISHLLAEAGPNYAPMLPKIAECAASLAGGTCRIHLPGEDGSLSLAAQFGEAPADQPERLVDRAFQNRETLFLPPDSAGESKPAGAAFGMIVPLLFQETVLGTLTVTRTAPGNPLESDEITTIRTVADRIALAITNSHLYTDLRNALAEEQKARQQLIRTEKLAAMGRLLGSVAHELNNPLQTIKNCLYLVQQEAPAVSSIQSYIGMASSETERLVHLVAELRELYRPRPDHTPSLCDLVDILREVRSLMAQPLYDGKVRWEQAADAKGYIVRGEKERIQQVFINLVTNAIEAMQPAGGTLNLQLIHSEDNRQAGVVFRDTGPGVPAAIIGNLFEPFITTKSTGLGLGLSICYEIAQKHGGHIGVENPSGGGAAFTFWIPLASGERRARQAAG